MSRQASKKVQLESPADLVHTLQNWEQADKKEAIRFAIRQISELQEQVSDVVQKMDEKVRQVECLNEVSALLNSTLDAPTVREEALKATCRLLECETASLLMIDEETNELYWDSALGETGKRLEKEVRLALDDRSIAGVVAVTGKALIVNDLDNDERHSKEIKERYPEFHANNMICIPLNVKGKVVGVLQAINKLETLRPRASEHNWPDFFEEDLALFKTLGNQVSTAIENANLYGRIKKLFFDTVEALAEAIEKKDRYTGGHTKRVVYYSLCIARHMNLSEQQIERLKLSAILHDVGKIGIEDKILKKAAPLDLYEWPVMKEHPDLGYEIMKRVEGLEDVTDGMRYHHERWDGNGYPRGLKEAQIPLFARIIAVADTYDAMVSTRPYRKGLAPQIAFEEIKRNSGSQFCPSVVEAFVKAFKVEKMGKGSGGASRSNR